MKQRILGKVFAAALLLAFSVAPPAHADSANTKFTGKLSFISFDALPVESPGNAGIELSISQWFLDATDSRVTGTYTVDGQCTRLVTKGPGWGPCHGTFTVTNQGDSLPEWQGLVTVQPQFDRFFWNFSGHGQGVYEGYNLKFKVVSGTDYPYPWDADGQIVGK